MSGRAADDSIPSWAAICILLGITLLATVIVAGTIWVGIPTPPESPPSVQFTWEDTGDELVVTKKGGDDIEAHQLAVYGENITHSRDRLSESDQFDADATLTYGDQIVIGSGYYRWTNASKRQPVRLVWRSSDGELADTIARWEPQDT